MSEPVIHELHGHPAYWCPVCDRPHWLDARWKFNGDRIKPSFGPASPGAKFSYLSYYDAPLRFALERPGKRGWLRYGTPEEANTARTEAKLGPEWKVVPVPAHRHVYCHVHIRNGICEVLGDSQRFGGKNIPLQPWDPTQWR